MLLDDECQVIYIEEDLDAEIRCEECGDVIPDLRLKAVSEAAKCTACDSKKPFEKKHITEPWGTREEFKKDRCLGSRGEENSFIYLVPPF